MRNNKNEKNKILLKDGQGIYPEQPKRYENQ